MNGKQNFVADTAKNAVNFDYWRIRMCFAVFLEIIMRLFTV
jgi:hypothetical protein